MLEGLANVIDWERRDVLAWLSRLEPESDFERLFGQRHPGTGTWLVESVQFKEWMQAERHCLLWCHGSGMSPVPDLCFGF